MIDLESSVIAAVISNKGLFEAASTSGFTTADFDSARNKKVWGFIEAHYKRHDDVPSLQLVAEAFQFEPDLQGLVPDFAVEEFSKRRLFKAVQQKIAAAEKLLRSNNPDGALEALKSVQEINGSSLVVPDSLYSYGEKVLENYEIVRSGKMGAKMGWPSIDHQTRGLWPGTTTFILARPNTGKTWVLVRCAAKFEDEGERVLLISPEMRKEEIAERRFILGSKVSGFDVIRGTLSSFAYQAFEDYIAEAKSKRNIAIIDAGDDLSEEGMEAAIRAFSPTVVIADSIYSLGFKGTRSERTEKAVEWMVRSSGKHKIPFLGLHQLSRDVGTQGYRAAAIALTDKLLWDADNVFIIEQDEDMKIDKKVLWHTAKLRRGIWPDGPVEMNWDFDKMDFSEVGEVSSTTGFTDDDFNNEDYDFPF